MKPIIFSPGLDIPRVCRPMFFFAMLFALIASSLAMGQDLNAEQQQKLNAVKSGLQRVTVNLQLALDTAGPGTDVPAGSKAKLARMRLDTAAADVPQLKQWLADLPAGQAEVKPLIADLATVEQNIAALDARLAGKSAAPAPTATEPNAELPVAAPVPAAPQAPAVVKLGYQQEEVLKGAQFNLREVEGDAAALTELVNELKPVADQLSIDHRRVRAGLNTVTDARRKAGFTQDGLAKLPANGQGVAETFQALAAANTEVDAADAYLGPLGQELSKLIDPVNYPQLQADIKRLGELANMYSNPMVLQTDRPLAAAVLTEATAARQEASRIAGVYQRLIEQQTDEGKRIENSGNNFLEKQQAFLDAAELEKQALPQYIQADLNAADDIANEAVAQKNPLLFTGGVPQQMGFAADKLALYAVLDPANAPSLEQEVKGLQTSLKQREKSLGDLIIQQNPLPPDRYAGRDREKVVAVAVDAWKHQQAKFTVLSSRIPSEAWNRETMWQYSNGTWYYVDQSKLQVQLIIADENDASLAIIRPVNIWMNHQKGDALIGTPLDSGDDELLPGDYMQRDKIK